MKTTFLNFQGILEKRTSVELVNPCAGNGFRVRYFCCSCRVLGQPLLVEVWGPLRNCNFLEEKIINVYRVF